MFAYGIRGPILKWFESYLADRSQYVTYDGINSDTSFLKCGVPQGVYSRARFSSLYLPTIFLMSLNYYSLCYMQMIHVYS